jgi:ubiquitin-like-specific protease 2
MHSADDSQDEIDFLTPRPSLHERMRGKVPKRTPTIQNQDSTVSTCIKLQAVFVSNAYGSTSSGLELVCFQSHMALLHDLAECAKVALRDIQAIQLGGTEHALLALYVSTKSSSARSIASLCGEIHLDTYALLFFVQPNDPEWPALYERLNSCFSAEILNETACCSLYNDAMRSNTKPLHIPGMSQSRQAPRKPTPIMIGERREITRSISPAVEDSSSVHQTRARVRSEQSLQEAKETKPILRYPTSGPFAVTLLQCDLERLKEGEYLNDTMIEFGLRYLLERIKRNNPLLVQQIHVFNTFFYHKLTESRDRSKTYEHLRKWTNKVNIFDKMYVVVPINEHLHWYMAIIVNPKAIINERPLSLASSSIRRSSRTSTGNSAAPGVLDSSGPQLENYSVNHASEHGDNLSQNPSDFKEEQTYVMVLDSLGITHGPVKTALRDYLRLEARDKGHVRPDVDLKRLGDPLHVDVRVPDQPNFSDCGVYLLHYFDRFFSDPVLFTEISLAARRNSRTEVPIHDAWRSEEVTGKRTWWASIVTDLAKDYSS